MGCDGMGMCCEKKGDDWVQKCMVYEVEGPSLSRLQDQEEDQRGPGERLSKRTVKHVN